MRDWRERYPHHNDVARAHSRLHAAGYGLTHGEQGGYWLRSLHGAQWFPSWQAAYESAANGTAALVRMEERIAQ